MLAALAAATSPKSSMIIYLISVVTHYSRLGPDRGKKSQISTSEVSARYGSVFIIETSEFYQEVLTFSKNVVE